MRWRGELYYLSGPGSHLSGFVLAHDFMLLCLIVTGYQKKKHRRQGGTVQGWFAIRVCI